VCVCVCVCARTHALARGREEGARVSKVQPTLKELRLASQDVQECLAGKMCEAHESQG